MSRLQAEDRRTARVALAAGLVFVLALSLGRCGSREEGHAAAQDAPRWRGTDARLLAQAAVHEADWSAARDLGAIFQTIQGSRRPGETFAQAIRRRMPSLARGLTPRSWVLGLPVGPILRNPEGWPYHVHASHYSARWEALYGRAVGYVQGSTPPPCEWTPVRWVGRIPGRATLAALLESGAWMEAGCGATNNAYLVAVDVD